MKIGYLGPLLDYSGYGEANRHDVAALEAAGVEVMGKLVRYTHDVPDFGAIGKVINRVIHKDGDYQIKVIHTTPDQYTKYIEKGKYHIGRFFWETDLVPEQFAEGLKLCQEIWTGSEANASAIRKAGVEVPIHIIPQAIEVNREWPEPFEIEDFEGFLFYSVFEWTDRKNPKALLEAFWQEFQRDEKVGLLIKTYFRDFTYLNKREISKQVQKLKDKSGLSKFPPVFLYKDLMNRDQVSRLHKTGQCFVSAHRGEGWGIPQVEAMLAGNPIISTGYGGVHEHIDTKWILDYQMVPVKGMEHSARWYTVDQNWADVDIAELRKALREVYNDQKAAREIGKKNREMVVNKFNLETVGNLMRLRLTEIERSLQ